MSYRSGAALSSSKALSLLRWSDLVTVLISNYEQIIPNTTDVILVRDLEPKPSPSSSHFLSPTPPQAISATNPPAKTANPNTAPTSLLSLHPIPALALVVAALALELVVVGTRVPVSVAIPVRLLVDMLESTPVLLAPVFVASPDDELIVVVEAELRVERSFPVVDMEEEEEEAAEEEEPMLVKTPPCKAAGADAAPTA